MIKTFSCFGNHHSEIVVLICFPNLGEDKMQFLTFDPKSARLRFQLRRGANGHAKEMFRLSRFLSAGAMHFIRISSFLRHSSFELRHSFGHSSFFTAQADRSSIFRPGVGCSETDRASDSVGPAKIRTVPAGLENRPNAEAMGWASLRNARSFRPSARPARVEHQ